MKVIPKLVPLISDGTVEANIEIFNKTLEDLGIARELFDNALQSRKWKSSQEFLYHVNALIAPWDSSVIDKATIDDITHFGKVYYFKKRTFAEMKEELKNYLFKMAKFRANSLEEIFDLMSHFLIEANARYPKENFKFINSVPDYGGPMKKFDFEPMPDILPMNQRLRKSHEHREDDRQYYVENLDDNLPIEVEDSD